MPEISYKAYGPDGNIVEGAIDAANEAAALDALHKQGLLAFEAVVSTPRASRRQFFLQLSSRPQLTLRQTAEFTRELAGLLQAEMPIDQSLNIVAENADDKHIKDLAIYLHSAVTAGNSLSDAIVAAPIGLPRYLPSMIRAGEARGNLAATLTDIARLTESRSETEAKIKSALTYPLVLIVAALGALTIVIHFLVPALVPLFENASATPPIMLRALAHVSAFLGTYGLFAAALLVVAAGTLIVALRRESARLAIDDFVLRLPYIGRLRQRSNAAVLTRTLGLLMRAGVPLVQAMEVAASAIDSSSIANAVREATDDIKQGRKIADALGDSRRLPGLALRFIKVGEESGRLESMLIHVADLLEKDTQRQIERGITLLGPALTMVIGLGVGWLIVSVMQAILEANQLIVR